MPRKLHYLALAIILLAAAYYYRHESAPTPRASLQHNTIQGMYFPSAPPRPAAASPPPVGGGAAAEPPAGLSSDNPNERLQVVRQAQDKWGDHKPATMTDEHAIVGRWDHPWTDSAYITFYADGTFKMVGWLRDVVGMYRFLSYDQIEFDQPGLLYGRSIVNIEYRLLKDT